MQWLLTAETEAANFSPMLLFPRRNQTALPTSSCWHFDSHQESDRGADRATQVHAPLKGGASVDAVVIGGGVSGLLAALRLLNGGASVIVLEAAIIGTGASGRGSGVLMPALANLTAGDMASQSGARGQRWLIALRDSAAQLVQLIEREKLDCRLVQGGALLHARAGPNDQGQPPLDDWNRLGAEVELANPTPEGQDADPTNYTQLIWRRGGKLDPLALSRSLAARIIAKGGRIHERTPVLGYGRAGLRWVTTTPKGRIDSRGLLVMANAYADIWSRRIATEAVRAVWTEDCWHLSTTPRTDWIGTKLTSVRPWIVRTFSEKDRSGAISIRAEADGSIIVSGIRATHAKGAISGAAEVLSSIFGKVSAETLSSSTRCVWRTRHARTASGLPFYCDVGPDGFAWMGGPAGDLCFSAHAAQQFADAILGLSPSDLALSFSEPAAIRWKRVRSWIAWRGGNSVPYLP